MKAISFGGDNLQVPDAVVALIPRLVIDLIAERDWSEIRGRHETVDQAVLGSSVRVQVDQVVTPLIPHLR
jgi:hypothetical protein